MITKRGKKAQGGAFGMSFSMIFSVILIIFFIAAAFFAIRFFLGFQKSSQIGLFLEDFQTEIDSAWNSNSYSADFESSLPNGIEYVCFINMSSDASSSVSSVERSIYKDIRAGSYSNNFVFYPVESAGGLSHSVIEHIQMPDENPLCLEVLNGIAKIRLEKDFNSALVEVS